MEAEEIRYPIIDLHCDLLHYLVAVKDAHPMKKEDIGCALPYLQEGNVKLQVHAIWTAVEKGSTGIARQQAESYSRLLSDHQATLVAVSNAREVEAAVQSDQIAAVAAIENASGICEEDEPLDTAFVRLKDIVEITGRLLYVSFTHHEENRFGGGNYSKTGLKDDGEVLLDYLDGKKIAVDLSHTSDALAYGILDYIDANGLEIPIIASHSNYRSVYEHARNLPDELVEEIIRRRGLIGLNLLRAFLHPDNPAMLAEHVQYGLELGAKEALCFGADYFCPKTHPDQSRVPFYLDDHDNAGKYQKILQSLEDILSTEELEGLAYGNALAFFQRNWGSAQGAVNST